MKVVVDISDIKVTNNPRDELITYSLGSCIGVVMYDPVVKVGGMLHCQLPSAKKDLVKSKKNPAMFVDSGIELLLQKMQGLGAEKKRIKVKLAGAAQLLNDGGMFQIGKRNHAAARQFFWKNGMFIDAEDIGGAEPRTMTLKMTDGTVMVRSLGVVSAM